MRRCEQQMSDPDADLSKLLDRYGQLQLQFEELGGYLLEDRILASLRGLGIAQLQRNFFAGVKWWGASQSRTSKIAVDRA